MAINHYSSKVGYEIKVTNLEELFYRAGRHSSTFSLGKPGPAAFIYDTVPLPDFDFTLHENRL